MKHFYNSFVHWIDGIFYLDCRGHGSTMAGDPNSNWSGKITSKMEACSTEGFSWVGIQRCEEERTGLCFYFEWTDLFQDEEGLDV